MRQPEQRGNDNSRACCNNRTEHDSDTGIKRPADAAGCFGTISSSPSSDVLKVGKRALPLFHAAYVRLVGDVVVELAPFHTFLFQEQLRLGGNRRRA